MILKLNYYDDCKFMILKLDLMFSLRRLNEQLAVQLNEVATFHFFSLVKKMKGFLELGNYDLFTNYRWAVSFARYWFFKCF